MKNKVLKNSILPDAVELPLDYFDVFECKDCTEILNSKKVVHVVVLRGSPGADTGHSGICPICYGKRIWYRC